jgi:hypothetical protein
MARERYTDVGFAQKKNVDADSWDTPWYCGDTDKYECDCYGNLYRSLLYDPLTGKRMEAFTEIREHKFQMKKTENDGFEFCDAATFGGDQLDGARHQCWCEPYPQKVPNYCADEGDECLCNGVVTYGQKFNSEGKPDTLWNTALASYYAVNDWNNTKAQTCEPKNFEYVELPIDVEKGCFCDEDRAYAPEADVQMVKEYWRGIMAEKAAQEEKARREAEAEAAAKRAAEEEAKRKAEEERKRKAEEAEKKRRDEQAAAERKRMEEAEKKRQECENKRLADEKARIAKEQEAHKKAEDDAVKKE